MTMIKTEGVHAGEFILSEANGTRSRDEVVISTGAGVLAAGTLIGQITASNALTATAASGNTGNGTLGSSSVTSGAVSGEYALEITKAAANGGDFRVTAPGGTVIGTGTVGTAFSAAGISFTLSAGSTDFAKGDSFTLAVHANLGEYLPYSDAGTDDGRRTAAGILYAPVDATAADVRAVAVLRDAEVVERLLVGLDANGRADLLANGIIVRP